MLARPLVLSLVLTVFSTSLNAAAPSQVKSSPDKALVRADFLKDMNADFAKMDSNHDGKLTAAEVEAWQRGNAMREVLARNQQLFRDLDKDHNGQLSEAEFAEFHAQPAPPNAAPMLKQFDGNRDGSISLIEFRTGTLANFDRLDADKDGIVSTSEANSNGIGKR